MGLLMSGARVADAVVVVEKDLAAWHAPEIARLCDATTLQRLIERTYVPQLATDSVLAAALDRLVATSASDEKVFPCAIDWETPAISLLETDDQDDPDFIMPHGEAAVRRKLKYNARLARLLDKLPVAQQGEKAHGAVRKRANAWYVNIQLCEAQLDAREAGHRATLACLLARGPPCFRRTHAFRFITMLNAKPAFYEDRDLVALASYMRDSTRHFALALASGLPWRPCMF